MSKPPQNHSEGQYQLNEINGFPNNQTFQINFQDIDSTINGDYNDLDTIVEFTNPQFVWGGLYILKYKNKNKTITNALKNCNLFTYRNV